MSESEDLEIPESESMFFVQSPEPCDTIVMCWSHSVEASANTNKYY